MESQTGGNDVQNDEQTENVVENKLIDADLANSGTKRVKHYKCFYNGDEFGRFSGKYPKQASKKAFRQILLRNKPANYKDGDNLRFSLIEYKRGKNKNTYTYSGNRVELEQPINVTKQNTEKNTQININFRYKTQIKREKDAEVLPVNPTDEDAQVHVPIDNEEKKVKVAKIAKVQKVAKVAKVPKVAKVAKVAKVQKEQKSLKRPRQAKKSVLSTVETVTQQPIVETFTQQPIVEAVSVKKTRIRKTKVEKTA